MVAIAIIAALLAAHLPAPRVRTPDELKTLLPSLAHGRPLVVHVCATWCAACREEFAKEHKFFDALEKRGVSVVLVWIDEAKTRPAIPKLTARYHLDRLPAIVVDAPEPEPVAKALQEPIWDGTLPATFVYDVHQVKLSSFLGSADSGQLDAAVSEAIRRAK
jgi:thiol-disulfide isomerase/thioredoxin